jgi:thiol-disulfide isomerase/thioredoxin
MKRNLILFAAAAMLLASCNNSTYVISGKLEGNKPGAWLVLDELRSNLLESVDSVKLTESGDFRFKRKSDVPMFFILKAHEQSFLTILIEPGEKLQILAHYDTLNTPRSVKGATGTEILMQYNEILNRSLEEISGLSDIYMQNIDNPELDKIIEQLDQSAQAIIDNANVYTKQYIDENSTSLVSLFMLYQQIAPGVHIMNPVEDLNYFLRVDSILYSLYPKSEPVAALHEQVLDLKTRISEANSAGSAVSEGAFAPEIALPSVKGDTIRLSSTRGKIVLVDFWAAWCPPCRQESPYLNQAYDKFSKKGFEIYQVSLDRTREDWVKGIEDDKLGRWIHVSDVMYWNSVVVPLFKIESIPFNLLLDEEGRIIDSNLRGQRLIEVLESYLN